MNLLGTQLPHLSTATLSISGYHAYIITLNTVTLNSNSFCLYLAEEFFVQLNFNVSTNINPIWKPPKNTIFMLLLCNLTFCILAI